MRAVELILCRCEVPEDTSEQARLQLLVDWILAHPDAVEEVRGGSSASCSSVYTVMLMLLLCCCCAEGSG